MHSKNQKRHGSPLPSRSPLIPMKPKALPAVAPSPGDTLAFRVPKEFPHSRFSKAPLAVYPPKGARSKTCVSLPVVSLKKMPCLSRGDPTSHVRLTPAPSSSSSYSPSPSLKPVSLTPPASQRCGEKLTNGRSSGGSSSISSISISSGSSSSGPSTPRSATPPSSLDRKPSPSRSPLDRRPTSTPSPSPAALERKLSPSILPLQRPGAVSALSSILSSTSLEKKQQNGTKASSKSHRRLSGRVFDPNKHCGVQDPETKRPCTRSLTCKTHSLTHRRAVPGRRKHFNILLAEHKGRAKEAEKDGDGAQGAKERCGQAAATQESPSKSSCPNGRPLSTLKLRLANAHIPRVPGGYVNATSSSVPPAPAPAVAANPELSPLGWVTTAGDGSRVSSDEGEAETPNDTDRPAFLYSNHHPQPLGFCVYSSRLLGRGHYVFDRRWDRMRLALQSMVEKHLNSQMWRKVPLAADSLLLPSSSGPSSVTPQPTSSPTVVASPLLTSPSDSPSCTAASTQSTAGVLGVQGHAPVSTPGKARNSAHKTCRPSKDREDSDVGSKKRKNSYFFSSSTSSSLSSPPPPSLCLTVDNHKRNGSSYHSTLQSPGAAAAAAPFKRKGLDRGGGSGPWHGGDDWLSRSDVSQSLNSQSSRSLGSTSLPYPSREPASASAHQPLAPPSAPLAYGGGVEGRKRRSPSSYRGKTGKLNKPGDLESLFGKGNDIGGILTYGPESPRQAKLHH